MKTNQEEINRFVHEAITGNKDATALCECGCNKYLVGAYQIPTYLEHGKPWGELLNWAMKQEWWKAFKYWVWNEVYNEPSPYHGSAPDTLFADPEALATKIKEYLEAKNES